MSSTKLPDAFNSSRNRIHVSDVSNEKECANAAYAESHNLQSLFTEMAAHLSEKDPKTELEAERILLDFLSIRKAERDRAALRLNFRHSFEVNIGNGRKVLKLQLHQDTPTLQMEQHGRSWKMDEIFVISLEQVEELTEMLYELGRFFVDVPKGEHGGFISIDDHDVFFLNGGKECMEAADEFFSLAMHMNMNQGKNV